VELSIATWNCFGMAQGVFDALAGTRSPHGARFRDEDVRRAFEGHHVICVQEILSGEAEAFFASLGRARVFDANGFRWRPLSLRGSGLGVACASAIEEHRIHPFAARGNGWDRFARKGTLYARLNIDGVAVDVLNLHLQSGYDASHIAIRNAQLAEIGRRVEELGSLDRPFIVAGDFNVCGLGQRSADYELLRRTLPGFEDLGAADDLPTFDPHPERNCLAHYMEPTSPQQRLDYIFVRAPRFRTRRVMRVLDQPLRSTPPPERMKGAFASDHFALIAQIDIDV
jgi:endonuclease/exonuclease/phosphatase family metal-dependent hydrolase